ncbi:TRAP transporter substrate-binding protein [Hydrogenophaga sp.]|uniref:TRAP transporter substrate-binding protein n=1 Tax=Hydrogenophaga sp. TaxID=1904254 RepID=UPI003569F80C
MSIVQTSRLFARAFVSSNMPSNALRARAPLTALALALGSCLLAAPAVAEELSVATFLPPQHHTNAVVFKWLGEELAKRSNGTLSLKVYPGGQLGAGPVQQYKRAVEGVADIVVGVASYTPELFPKTLLTIPPGKANNSEELAERFLAAYDKHFADEFAAVKFLGIGFPAGTSISATKNLSTFASLKGAKIVPYSATTTALMDAMGVVPVQMPVTEVYTGLSTGTIDGAIAAHNNMLAPWNWQDVTKFYIDNFPAQFQTVYIVMNKERHKSLSPAHRKIIDDLAGKEFTRITAASFHRADDVALKAMKANSGKSYQFITVSDAERAKMDAAVAEGMKVIFAAYAAKGISNAKEIYDAVNK